MKDKKQEQKKRKRKAEEEIYQFSRWIRKILR